VKLSVNDYASQNLTAKIGYNHFNSTQLGYMQVKKGWIPIITPQKNIFIAYTNIPAPFFDFRCVLADCGIVSNNTILATRINLFNSTIYYSEFNKKYNEFGVFSILIKTFTEQAFAKYIAVNSAFNISEYKSKLSKNKLLFNFYKYKSNIIVIHLNERSIYKFIFNVSRKRGCECKFQLLFVSKIRKFRFI